MPELLTESFCERCGTRYTFESATPTKTHKLGRFKTLSKGLKNYVMSDDTSLDEALAAARSDDEREMTAHQLDAFHATFNFCMTCRQYTCGNCWNTAEGRCLTCAPHLGHEIMPAPFQEAPALEALRFDASAWPSADLPEGEAAAAEPEPEIDLAARLASLSRIEPAPAEPVAPEPVVEAPAWPEEVAAAAELVAAPAPEAEVIEPAIVEPEPEPAIAAAAESEAAVAAAPEPATAAPEIAATGPTISQLPADDIDGRAAAAARSTSSLLGRFRPGQSIDAELAAYEASLEGREAAALEAEPAVPEPVAAAPEPEPEPVAAEPEPVAAGPEPEPEPVAAAEATPPQAPTPVPADRVEQPTWRIVAPDVALPANGHPTPDVGLPAAASAAPPSPPQAAEPSEPQWPATPDWPKAQPSVPFLAGRAVATSAATEALWAASVRDIVANPAGAPAAVQPCSNCGLSLSATARFCRRCGTRQGA